MSELVWLFGANEGDSFELPPGTYLVRYGVEDAFNFKELDGLVTCDNTTFGDPVAGKQKHCEFQVNAPHAAFTVEVNDLTVLLTNNSTDAQSYVWVLGDGKTSVSTNTTHTYAGHGTYSVTLKATGLGGVDIFKTDIVV